MPRWLLIVMGVCGFGAVTLGVLLSVQGAAPAQAVAAAPVVTVPAATLEAVKPAAAEPDREARRLARYDKDDDGAVSREEYLAARRKAYAKLDANGDGVLQFEEYAAKTIAKFNTADASGDAVLSAAEFATTATRRVAKPKIECPPQD